MDAHDPQVSVPSQVDDPPIDSDVIETLRQLDKPGERSFLAEMVQIFFEDTPPRISALRQAIATGDADQVTDVAHALKGACGNFGAYQLEARCLDLELTGRSGSLDRAQRQLSALESEYSRVHAALSEYLV